MAHIEEVHDTPHQKKGGKKRKVSSSVQLYLYVYNAVSAIGWSYVLIGSLIHLFNLPISLPYLSATAVPFHAFPIFSRLASLEASLPAVLVPVLQRATTTYARIGKQTALVQSLAILEVLHAVLGWVGSGAVTTLVQVASRYMLVWGIAPLYPAAQTTPFYASMVLSWSITEVIRYTHFAITLLGYEPYILLYLRYTTFYLLYPTGASSEAFCMFATLPTAGESWGLLSWVRAGLFGIWWPGLYVMYMHMVKRRRKVLGCKSSKSKSE